MYAIVRYTDLVQSSAGVIVGTYDSYRGAFLALKAMYPDMTHKRIWEYAQVRIEKM